MEEWDNIDFELEEESICPYPGLRTFYEEESIFFKGRERNVIEVTDLLKKQKFAMVTGASGDGKSSLIFAGLIPEIRAGFMPGSFNNWAVASFRPERDPLGNLASSLAEALGFMLSLIHISEPTRPY